MLTDEWCYLNADEDPSGKSSEGALAKGTAEDSIKENIRRDKDAHDAQLLLREGEWETESTVVVPLSRTVYGVTPGSDGHERVYIQSGPRTIALYCFPSGDGPL